MKQKKEVKLNAIRPIFAVRRDRTESVVDLLDQEGISVDMAVKTVLMNQIALMDAILELADD